MQFNWVKTELKPRNNGDSLLVYFYSICGFIFLNKTAKMHSWGNDDIIKLVSAVASNWNTNEQALLARNKMADELDHIVHRPSLNETRQEHKGVEMLT